MVKLLHSCILLICLCLFFLIDYFFPSKCSWFLTIAFIMKPRHKYVLLIFFLQTFKFFLEKNVVTTSMNLAWWWSGSSHSRNLTDCRWCDQPTSAPLLWWQSSLFVWLNVIVGTVILACLCFLLAPFLLCFLQEWIPKVSREVIYQMLLQPYVLLSMSPLTPKVPSPHCPMPIGSNQV